MTTNTLASYRAFAPLVDTSGPFAFTFRIFDSSDMRVVLRDTDGNDTVLVSGTDYTLSAGPWDSGGTVTTTVNVQGSIGEQILLKANIGTDQSTDFTNGDAFDQESVERMLDKAFLVLKQLQENIGRVFTLQETTSLRLKLIDDPTAAGDTLVYDGSGFSFAQISTYTPTNVVTSVIGRLLMVAASTAAAQAAIDLGTTIRLLVGGRLAANATDPLGGSGGTGINAIYYHPFKSDRICLYNPSLGVWQEQSFSLCSLAMAGLTDNSPFDVFGWSNGGVLTLEGVSWASDTARATALTNLGGMYVKSTDSTRLYLGTGYKFAGNVYDDNNLRGVWNMFNRIPKPSTLTEDFDLNWSYSTTTWRRRNGYSSSIDRVCGLADVDDVVLDIYGRFFSSTATFRQSAVGIGIDSTTVNSATITCPATMNNTSYGAYSAHLRARGLLGRHQYYPLEKGGGADTQTHQGVTGDFKTGMTGSLEC